VSNESTNLSRALPPWKAVLYTIPALHHLILTITLEGNFYTDPNLQRRKIKEKLISSFY
jgi:hypothetical protein